MNKYYSVKRVYRETHREADRASKLKWYYNNKEKSCYSSILQRCNNPNSKAYSHYGGRGIHCYLKSGQDIIETIGKWPGKGYSIDRIDNMGHYEIGNIRWATAKQQQQNCRSAWRIGGPRKSLGLLKNRTEYHRKWREKNRLKAVKDPMED